MIPPRLARRRHATMCDSGIRISVLTRWGSQLVNAIGHNRYRPLCVSMLNSYTGVHSRRRTQSGDHPSANHADCVIACVRSMASNRSNSSTHLSIILWTCEGRRSIGMMCLFKTNTHHNIVFSMNLIDWSNTAGIPHTDPSTAVICQSIIHALRGRAIDILDTSPPL